MALLASRFDGRMPLRQCQRVGRTFRAAWLKLFAEGNLFRTQALFSMDGGPTRRRVAATEEFLIDVLVAGAAIASRKVSANHKSVVIDLLLAGPGLVAVETIHIFLRVNRHLVFVNDRVLKASVTFGAFS